MEIIVLGLIRLVHCSPVGQVTLTMQTSSCLLLLYREIVAELCRGILDHLSAS